MDIENTFKEEYSGANEEFEKKRYINATILFSKSLFALCDIIIYDKLKKLPKNHSERFRILEEYFHEIYKTVDTNFGHYTDAYSKPIAKENCERIKNEINKIIKSNKVSEELKKLIR